MAELGRLVENVEKWLATNADAPMAPYDGTVKPAKSATVDSARRKVAELRADLHAVRSAPITSTAAKAKATAEIERLAERGRPDVYGLIEHGGEIVWPNGNGRAKLFGSAGAGGTVLPLLGFAHVEAIDALAFAAWLHRDQLFAAIDAEIDASADDAAALTAEARAERIAEIEAAILQAERIEVALVEQAGGSVLHRSAVDPRALLGLSSELPGPRDQ